MLNCRKENPFYFKLGPKNTIRWWEYPILWVLPTHVSLCEEYRVEFKIYRGKIYITRVDKL